MQKTLLSGGAWALYCRLLVYLKPLRLVFVYALLGSAMNSLSIAGFVYFVKVFIESLQGGEDVAPILFIPIGLLFLVIAESLGNVIKEYHVSFIGQRVTHEMRCSLYAKLMVAKSSFFDRRDSSEIVAKFTHFVASVSDMVSRLPIGIMHASMTILFLLLCMFWLSWKLTFLSLFMSLIIGVVLIFSGRRFRALAKQMQESFLGISRYSSEAVRGYSIFRLLGVQKLAKEAFSQKSEKHMREMVRIVCSKAYITLFVQLILGMVIVGVMYVILLGEDRGNIGSWTSYITACIALVRPFRLLSNHYAEIEIRLAASEELFDILDTEDERDDEGSYTPSTVKGHVSVKDVYFRYPGQKDDVLRGASLEVHPGEKVALVGTSGSGKSTLVSLILRFYDFQSGDINLDSVSIRDYSLENLRRHFGIVQQKDYVFNDTLMNNLVLGISAYSAKTIEKKIKMAGMDELLDALPQGYDTILGEDATTISGGQKQRLCLARMFIKDAPIIILDEATSALDNASERHIQKSLRSIAEKSAVFIIAHRLSSVLDADRIYVLHDGRIVESGKHKELMRQGGVYAGLVKSGFPA